MIIAKKEQIGTQLYAGQGDPYVLLCIADYTVQKKVRETASLIIGNENDI